MVLSCLIRPKMSNFNGKNSTNGITKPIMSSYSTVTTRTFIITGEMRDFCSASKKRRPDGPI